MMNPTPEQIQSELERGWLFYLGLAERDIEKAKGGCGCCGDKLTQCLLFILVGLQYRVDLDVYDDTTDKLYTDMMEIIGPSNIQYATAYYWSQADDTIPSYSDILEKDDVDFPEGSGIHVPFDPSGIPVYYFLAYPLSEPLKTHWEDTVVPTNFGDIGTGSDLFGAATTVNDLRVIVTNYPTQFDNPILFT